MSREGGLVTTTDACNVPPNPSHIQIAAAAIGLLYLGLFGVLLPWEPRASDTDAAPLTKWPSDAGIAVIGSGFHMKVPTLTKISLHKMALS